MSQLRLDPLTGRWVVISTDRADRPFASFVPRVLPVEADPSRPCPFCPGNEGNTPPEIERADASGRWQVRVLPNLYPAFSGDDPMVVSHLGPVFTQAPASGIHEVLVLSPEHRATWADLSDDHADQVMEVVRERMAAHATRAGLRYSQAIVNAGREAGASLEHPHGQLLGMPFIPSEITSEVAGFARFEGSCLLCTAVDAEESVGYRIVHADDRSVVICPFWSSMPYEMLVIPRRHSAHLHTARPPDSSSVGRTIRVALGALREQLGDVAYNVVFHSAPFRSSAEYHWHVHLLPKVTTTAGFELGTGVMINVVPPEDAANELRPLASAAA